MLSISFTTNVGLVLSQNLVINHSRFLIFLAGVNIITSVTYARQEELTDRIPNYQTNSFSLKPKRSDYYALDGTWLKYRGEDIVLLIMFDVETLDTVTCHPSENLPP